MLSTLVNENLLVPDANGEVSLDAIKTALAAVGISALGQKLLAHGGAQATESLERGVLDVGPATAVRCRHTSRNAVAVFALYIASCRLLSL